MDETDHETAIYYRTDVEEPQFIVKIMGVEVSLDRYNEIVTLSSKQQAINWDSGDTGAEYVRQKNALYWDSKIHDRR